MSVLLVIVAAACSSHGHSESSARTRVDVVRPLDGHRALSPGFSIGDTVAGGECTGGSEIVSSATTCTAQNGLFHVCWIEADHTHAVCAGPAWDTKLTLVTLISPAEVVDDPRRRDTDTFPWAVMLRDGTRCTAVAGSGNMIQDRRLNYGCEDDRELFGEVNRSSSIWTVDMLTGDDAHPRFTPVEIKLAWF